MQTEAVNCKTNGDVYTYAIYNNLGKQHELVAVGKAAREKIELRNKELREFNRLLKANDLPWPTHNFPIVWFPRQGEMTMTKERPARLC